MDIKQLLLKQINEAYEREMSLMAALNDLKKDEFTWRLYENAWTIEEIIYHVASCTIEYCKQGFGKWNKKYIKPENNIKKSLDLLKQSHEHLLECLLSCSLENLILPIKTRCHGESAYHFFWIMITHYINHAEQILTIRRGYSANIKKLSNSPN